MSKKFLVICLSVLAGLFMATSAMAGLPETATDVLLHQGTHTSGTTAGTIVNPEGKGDLLIFPYYDVRELNGKSQETHFFIINEESFVCLLYTPSTSQCFAGYAAKLRFREWDKSEEVFDVDIWLSRGDVWYGRLTHNTGLALPYGTRLTTPETDYVIIDADNWTFTLGTPFLGGFDFPTTAYIPGPTNPPYPGPLAPKSPGSNNLYGYIEVIGEEMTFDHYTPPTAPSTTIKVTRGAGNGNPSTGLLPTYLDAINQLYGYAYIVRVADGISLAYNATALANFSVNQGSLFQSAGGLRPGIYEDAEDTLDQVEFQLSKLMVKAGYDVEDAIAGKFSLVLNFPTKRYHFCARPTSTSSQAWYTIINGGACASPYPDGNPWNTTLASGSHGSAINAPTPPAHANDASPIQVIIFDRDEHFLTPPKTFISPQPPVPSLALFYELNILGLYKGTPPTVPQLSGWTTRDNVAVQTADAAQTFDRGYIDILFPFEGIIHITNHNLKLFTVPPKIHHFWNFGTFYEAYQGLPVIPLALQEFSNGNVGGFYGDIRNAFYESFWLFPSYPPNP